VTRHLLKIITLTAILFIPLSGGADINLTWQECVKLAREHNPSLKAAREMVNQQRAVIGITRGPLLPEITANGEISTGDNTTAGRYNRHAYSIDGNQLLFDGLKSYYDLKEADSSYQASLHQYRVTSSEVRLALKLAFINLLTSRKSLETAETILARRKLNLDLIAIRYRAGREHKGSLLTARADYREAKHQVVQAERAIALYRKGLATAIGITPSEKIEITGQISVADYKKEDPDFNELTRQNPLLKQMIKELESARYSKKSARVDFLPKVYAFFNVGVSDDQFIPRNTEWSVGVKATLPLVQGGSRIYTVQKNESYYKQVLAQTADTRDTVLYTLFETWNDLRSAADYVTIREQYVKANIERAKIAKAQYSIGLVTFDSWIIIENNLAQARNNLVSSERDALIAEAKWIQAKGGILEYE
jgi:outer membrane protein TolC